MRIPFKKTASTIEENQPLQRDWEGHSSEGARRPFRKTKGAGEIMRRHFWLCVLLMAGLWGQPAAAQGGLLGQLTNLGGLLGQPSGQSQRLIIRTNIGLLGLQGVCLLNGCNVVGSLDGTLNQVFLITAPLGIDINALAGILRLVPGILDVELDQNLVLPPNPAWATTPPPGLWDKYPVNYFGTTVWNGYANQPAAQIIRLSQAQNTFHVSGAGVVADIDTGVDPNHPALKSVLLPGYDFTRNQPGGSEMTDIGQYTASACDDCQAAFVNQSTAAMLDQSTAAMLDGNPYAAFGHGTMVAGVIHLVAPTAHIMPLKAFHADGTGYLSDILRAIYYAVQNHANVINMSFDLTVSSTELSKALNYATSHNVVSIASAGNDGKQEIVYPAALQENVMGVASTNDFDQRSSFSNYGNQVVWVAAPGEAIITTYPFGTYSAGWGTSFSSPLVAGTVSLLLNEQPGSNQSQAASAVAHAQWIGSNMGHGRLDIYRAVSTLSQDEDWSE
jgi:subtilisin family serine protease